MKRLFLAAAFIAYCSLLQAQGNRLTDTLNTYFDELQKATKQNYSLWNYNLYGPVLLVNPSTREVFANFPDSAGLLKADGKIYTGTLPKNVNISNTALKWSGLNWAMVMLPLPQNKNNRINLLAHELFHRAQNMLGFTAYNPDNNHLDKKDARIYLRLELEALKKALIAKSAKEMRQHITHALAFRKHRQSIYAGADSTENLMELNEGICEFTGMMMSERSKKDMPKYFADRINYFTSSPSYIRSFAYEAIPVYGYLLSSINKDWNKQINASTKLDSFFLRAFSLKWPVITNDYIANISQEYNAKMITGEETAREERIIRQIIAYRNKLIDSPHTELPLIKMNMSFDYTKMFPLENFGTVYPQIRITDEWGILEVEQGALIKVILMLAKQT